MTDQITAIARARAARADLAKSKDPEARAFGEALAEYFEQAAFGVTLEEVLGLAAMPGQSYWWTLEAIARRDAALREAARLCPEMKIARQACQIERAAVRYAATAWRFDKSRKEMPPSYVDTVKECLWRAFKADPDMPVSKRTLERVLSKNRRSKAP